MRRSVRLSIAASAAAATTLSVVAAVPAGAAPANRLAPSVGQSATVLHAQLSGRRTGVVRPAGVPSHGSYSFLLELATRSTAQVYGARLGRGARVAGAAARAQLHAISSAQSRLIARLPARTPVLYRLHAAMNGVAVTSDVRNYARLTALPGVRAVYPIAPKYEQNSYAVPFQGGAQAWTTYGDRGARSTIAIIDSGVDYTHADFGGPGTVAAYRAARATDTAPAAPTSYDHAKFDATTLDRRGRPAYFYDFAGDAYNPARAKFHTPRPDPNPLDCGGHGSHVAGTAAGYGVTSDGHTYTGPYSTSTPFSDLRVGPGMAPLAHLAVYKVFGCHGGTTLLGEAIDKAMDPNGDGSTADHVNVINMSIGGDYDSPQEADTVLASRAARTGITVVSAAGNGGDLYDVGGAPADSPRVIAVASSVDASTVTDTLRVAGPPDIAGRYAALRAIAYKWHSKPDLSGTVVALSAPNNKDGCLPLSNADKSRVAGKIVFEDWASDDAVRRCGSSDREANLEHTAATGYILGDDQEPFPGAFGITGGPKLPGVLVAKTGADRIRAELAAGHTVTIARTRPNNFDEISPRVNDQLSFFSSRGIGDAGNVKPDIAAVGDSVFSAAIGTGNRGKDDSGTSMATPMVAGAAALITSRHPRWRPMQVKADLMNTANHDLFVGTSHHGARFAPNRVGAGRLDVQQALQNSVLAYTVDGPNGTNSGNVSASFGPIAVRVASGRHTYRKTIRLQNTGGTAATYTASFVTRTRTPGAAYSVRPGTVHVAPHSTRDVTLTLSVSPRLLIKTIDPTVSRFDGGLPRLYRADASGLVEFASTGRPTLRVPAYAAPRPASNMMQPRRITLSRGATQTALLRLSGNPVDQGRGATAISSTVAGFELQAVSGQDPHCSKTLHRHCVDFADQRSADIHYVGTTSDAPQLRSIGKDAYRNGLAYFSITTHHAWRTPVGPQSFRVYIDGNGDGRADAVLVTARLPGPNGDTDVPVTELLDIHDGFPLDIEPINDAFGDTDTALLDSNTIVLPVYAAAIPGVTRNHSRIHFVVVSNAIGSAAPTDTIGRFDPSTRRLANPMTMDVLHPGLAVFGSYTGNGSPLLFADSPGSVLEVRRNRTTYTRDHALGGLLIHLHNTSANRAQRVALSSP